MLNDTLFNRLASGFFFIESNILYKPTASETDIRLIDPGKTLFRKTEPAFYPSIKPMSFTPVGTLDEVENFDVKGRYKGVVDQIERSYLDEILSEQYILMNIQDEGSRYDIGLRKIARYIFYEVFPEMFVLGAERGGYTHPPEKKRAALNLVLDKLATCYGEGPLNDIPIDRVVRESRVDLNLDTDALHDKIDYNEREGMSDVFARVEGDSVLAKIFGGKPYFGCNNKLYQLTPDYKRGNPGIITPAGKFGIKEVSGLSSIKTQYPTVLEDYAKNKVLTRLENNSQSWEALRSPEWYVRKTFDATSFEWDYVGFFIVRDQQVPTCVVYRRILKFAVVYPRQESIEFEQRKCNFFGETRVGLKVKLEGDRIKLGNRPLVLNHIGHPAEQYGDIGYKEVCNNSTYTGSAANRIIEGIAVLKHSVRAPRAHHVFTVREAQESGFEIVHSAL